MNNVEKYIVNADEIDKFGKKIQEYINNYEEIVNELIQKLDNIRESALWNDTGVKENYINSCLPYINLYKNGLDIMRNYLNYYYAKTSQLLQIDNQYVKRSDDYGQ